MTVQQELDQIRAANADGRLVASEVVEFARNNTQSMLHGQFEWDDSAAAEAYRLIQARNIIRMVVIYPPNDTRQIRAWISPPSLRTQPGGGYVPVAMALTNDGYLDQLRREAIAEIQRLQRKFHMIEELAPIFAAAAQAVSEALERRRIIDNAGIATRHPAP